MRFLFRWAFRIFLLAIVLIVALALLKDTLIKALVEREIESRTGLDAKIGRLETGLLSPTLSMENLRLYNTAEFGGSPLADIPELHLEYDRSALAFRKLRFKLVRLHLSELNIVESRDGRTNIVGFVEDLQKISNPNASYRSALIFTGIDVLNLTLGQVKYTDLNQPAQRLEFQLSLKNEILTNIKTLPDLSNLILNILLNRGISITSRGDNTSITVSPKASSRPGASHAQPRPAPAGGRNTRSP